jgi:2-keto-4-pentenoate hydratase/2-oxohepta-3-ene-1,7-dioic acid hydratase in catechol pathway
MKLATFSRGGHTSIGAIDTAQGRLLDLSEASRLVWGEPNPAFASMLALIDTGASGLERAGKLTAEWPAGASIVLDTVRLLAPIPEPRQMRDCLTFELHLRNAIAQSEKRTGIKRPFPEVWFKQPIYYKTNRFSVVGHETDVVWPAYSQWMDFELELACIIGKTGKDIKPEVAGEHIFGFTIFNDFSARDAQIAEMAAQLGPAKGKDFDTGNVLGPWIVTVDEIGDPYDLRMDARINGERWGGGNSGSMHHKWPAILAHISQSETIHAGEIIGSGTVGTGCGFELGRQLQDGDIVELEIEKIGTLRNRVTTSKR